MLKKLAAIGLGAALVLAPLAAYADNAPAPAATPMMKKVVHHHVVHHVVKKPMVKKVVVHHVVHHHVVHHPMAKKPMPAPTPTKS